MRARTTIGQMRRSLAIMSGVSLATLLVACGTTGSAAEEGSGARVVKVAIVPTMPYIGVQNGKLIGLDGELFNKAADKLGLEVKPYTVNFTGLMAGVQAHRYDIGIGDIFWKAERAQEGIFTDPPFYSPVVLAERQGLKVTTVDGLKGKQLGTGQGFVYVPALQKVPGAKVHTYPTYQDTLQDLNAGRIDVAFLDPLTVSYSRQRDPKSTYDVVPLTPPDAAQLAAQPQYSAFLPLMTGWYLNKAESALEGKLSKIIREFYASGEAGQIVRKYGGDPETMLKPYREFSAQRRATDRPADWKAPSIP
ncbi:MULTISPECIES: transporter substrate-binding domain-containing protein [unclassified Nonomuraea]|uniref:substrate-binding periplasmic protein n=1 Tax=unclassified Nonomuraea TaxID=2593643 RepID=UPI0033C7C03F